MRPGDLDEVYSIEKESFHSPYKIEFFKEFPYEENCFLFVAEKPDKCIGGYIAYKIIKHKIQVVSIAVASHSRRMGIAQQLMKNMMEFANDCTIKEVYLHVSVMNFPAQNLYKSFGFTVSKWINNYYADENEHALIMVNKDIPSYVKNHVKPKELATPSKPLIDDSVTPEDRAAIQKILNEDRRVEEKKEDGCVFL